MLRFREGIVKILEELEFQWDSQVGSTYSILFCHEFQYLQVKIMQNHKSIKFYNHHNFHASSTIMIMFQN